MKLDYLLIGLGCVCIDVLGCGDKGTERTPDKPPARSTETQPPSEPAPESVPEQPVTLEIADLNKHFAADWQNTVRKYRGKLVQVTAKATGPSVLAYPRYRLMLNESGRGGGVTFDARVSAENHKTARSISAGQLVTVRGKYTYLGAQSRDRWLLENAEVIHFGEDPAVAVSAEVLASEFATDAEAASERFDEKTLLVEGTLLRQSADQGFFRLWLDGGLDEDGQKMVVRAQLNTETFDRFGQVPFTARELVAAKLFEPGQEVRVKGELLFSWDRLETIEGEEGRMLTVYFAYPVDWPEAWEEKLRK